MQRPYIQIRLHSQVLEVGLQQNFLKDTIHSTVVTPRVNTSLHYKQCDLERLFYSFLCCWPHIGTSPRHLRRSGLKYGLRETVYLQITRALCAPSSPFLLCHKCLKPWLLDSQRCFSDSPSLQAPFWFSFCSLQPRNPFPSHGLGSHNALISMISPSLPICHSRLSSASS